MNLHLSSDEKFIDFMINDVYAENWGNENHFLIYQDLPAELNYVKSSHIQKIQLSSPEWDSFFLDKISHFTRVYIHYLDNRLYDKIIKIPSSIKVIWCFYGADGFALLPHDYFLQPLTKKYLQQLDRQKWKITYPLVRIFLKANRFFFLKKRIGMLKKAITRINYFGNFLYQDYMLIKKATNVRATYLEMTLASLDKFANTNAPQKIGNNILIGNSATLTNNHLDIFEKLRNVILDKRKIYCPLSYGDDVYKQTINEKGYAIFKENFSPLLEFLPLGIYNSILNDCGFVFMNQDRSQGGANVVTNIYFGAKVFMSIRNPYYHFFKKLGVVVFCIQNELENKSEIFKPLQQKEVDRNRELIYEYFSENAHLTRLKKAFNI